MFRLTTLFSLILFLISCSPQKLLEKGKPDKAFKRAALQVERNSNAKTSTLEALAASYTLLQQYEYGQVSRLANSSSPNRWEGMVELLEQLDERKQRVSAIRLTTKRVIRLDQLKEPAYTQELVVAKREAAAHLLRRSNDLIELAENGDMLAAREAFSNLERRDRYAPRTAAITRLSNRAVHLGTVRVAFDAQGRVSSRDIDLLSRSTMRVLSRQWVEVYPIGTRDAADAHLIAELDIASPYVGSLRKDQSRQRFKRTIEERKKVGIDTSGNAIYELLEKKLTATVVTESLYRESRASAQLNIFNAKTGTMIKSRRFNGAYVFEDVTAFIKGNRAALGSFCPPHLDRQLSSPPSSFRMKDEALEALRCAIPNINLDLAVDSAAFVAR